MIIYKATNKINGISYIGQTIFDLDKRINQHINEAKNNKYNSYFHSALKKYGIDNFDWDIIDETDNINELNRLETYYIGWYDTYNNGYNLTKGGGGSVGYKLSKETKRKISKSHFKPIILIHPNGKEEKFGCMMDACKKYNLFKGTLSLTAQGKRKQYKGFKCKYD